MNTIKEDSMNEPRSRRSRASAAALLACLTALLAAVLCPGVAGANTYNVTACNDAPGSVNHSWATYSDSPTATIAVGQGCPSAGYQPGDQNNTNHGLFARYVANSLDPNNAFAGWAFDAPPGNNISSLTLSDWFSRANGGQYAMLLSEFGALEGCWENDTTLCGSVLGPHTLAVGGATHLATEVGCHNLSGCRDGGNGTSGLFTMYGVTVTVNDLTAPAAAGSGPLWTGAWQGGTHSVTISGSDGADGIQRNDLKIDGNNVIVGAQHGCDYTYAHPCANQSDTYTYDTHQLADGVHSVQAVTWDGGWLSGVANGTIYVDNHAPDMSAVDVTVAQGSGWRPTNGFDLSWTTPGGQPAPIVKAHYSVCQAASPSTCPVADGQVSGSGVHAIPGLNMPAAGDYLVRVWLEDAAGNVNRGLASLPVHLRYDPTVPGQAAPLHRNGWLNAREAQSFAQEVQLPKAEVVGPSGIAGYAVTTDGTVPGDSINVPGSDATYLISDLLEGTNTIKARAISGAGVPSSEVGTTTIQVDKTPPTAKVTDAPNAADWQRHQITLSLSGTDQEGLSGMQGIDPSDGTAQPTGRAYLEYRLDGGPRTDVPGDNSVGANTETLSIPVLDDGQHTLTYKAVDLAGNESAEKTAEFKIDQTAPELVAFEAQDPAHPTTISVAVADKTSGIAGGGVEMRKRGASRWTDLPTHLSGDHLVASVDDSQLTAGAYEFQALARDVAGNETVSNHQRDGGVEVLNAPFRFNTRMDAGIVNPSAKKKAKKIKASAKCRRSRKCMAQLRRRRNSAKKKAAQWNRKHPLGGTAPTMTVAYGKSALVKGTLLSNDGTPIAGQVVDVYKQLDAAGQQMTRIATLRTDARGQFHYHAGKGASRTVRFMFDGTETLHPAQAEVKLRVPASSTLRVNRHKVRNGRTVRFTGRIGLPVSAARKVVDLQAFYRSKWRTFGTARTDSKGAWKYTYRFEATTGLVTYKFRVRVQHEASYPYQLGYSKVVKVTVRGR
jgi:hypothetical protein